MSEMTLKDTLLAARGHDDVAVTIVITRFKQSLLDCAERLESEDAYDDFVADLIQLILESKLETYQDRSDGEIFNFFRTALNHRCAKRLRKKINHVDEMPFAELTDSELVDLEEESAIEDIYFRDDLLSPLDLLTHTEKSILILLYEKNKKPKDIAARMGVSQQDIYQIKKRAVHKLGQALAASQRRA